MLSEPNSTNLLFLNKSFNIYHFFFEGSVAAVCFRVSGDE